MHVGIVGYGKMGQSVWQLLRRLPYRVSVVVRTEQQAQHHRQQFLNKLDKALRRSGMNEAERAERLAHADETCRFSHRLEALRDADVVLENVTEEMEVKTRLLAELEAALSGGQALVFTNTSSISIDTMAGVLRSPERFAGLHFFHPMAIIPLAEIITGSKTSPLTVEAACRFATALDRVPIVVADGPGSVINGVLVHYYAEAVYMLEEGAAGAGCIDESARKLFYVGPLESVDVIGLELLLAGLRHAPPFPSAVPIRIGPKDAEGDIGESPGTRPGYRFPPLLTKLHADGRLGKSAGKGVFVYTGGKPVEDDPSYYRCASGEVRGQAAPLDQEEILRRLLYAVFSGCLWALHLGLASVEALDVGVREILQMKDGPFSLMRRIGHGAVLRNFHELAARWGRRFDPSGLENLVPDGPGDREAQAPGSQTSGSVP